MQTFNPWISYFSIVGIGLAVYYLIIGSIYYRQELKAKLIHWKSPPLKKSAPLPFAQKTKLQTQSTTAPDETIEAIGDQTQEVPWENEQLMQQLESAAAQIQQAFQEAYNKEYDNQELVLLLQMILKEYPAIYGTPFQLSVNNLVETECEKYSSINLDSDDRMRMWIQEN